MPVIPCPGGFADFPLAASDTWIPLLYALAMGVDALAALAAPLVFSRSFSGAVAGMVFWGVSMGAQESVMRAAIAKMAPVSRRGSAYGAFNTVYGLCWFAGIALMGFLY